MSPSSANTTQRAEIHTHSTASDGAHAPSKVARLCHEAGVGIWSLTDHDNCYGCARAAEAAEPLGITFIPGIEISAYHDTSVHILGYGFDPHGAHITEYARRRVDSRRDRMHRMIERLADLGVDVSMADVEAVADTQVLGRPHLAKALVEAGQLPTVQAAFDKFLHTGGPAHVTMGWPSVEDAIDLVHRAGGIAVVAHPGNYGLDDAIADWVDAGLDGIEVRHPQHGRADAARYERLAERLGVLKTASSDFHGNRNRQAHFGNVDFPARWLHAFLERLDIPAPVPPHS